MWLTFTSPPYKIILTYLLTYLLTQLLLHYPSDTRDKSLTPSDVNLLANHVIRVMLAWLGILTLLLIMLMCACCRREIVNARMERSYMTWTPSTPGPADVEWRTSCLYVIRDIYNSSFINKNIWGPIFTKRLDVLPPNLVKSRSREIGCCNDRITLNFDRHLGSAAAEVPVKF